MKKTNDKPPKIDVNEIYDNISSSSSGDYNPSSVRVHHEDGNLSNDTHNMKENAENGTNEENFKWESDMQFWVMYLGQTIGFGSIWRFPSVINENGGGAF